MRCALHGNIATVLAILFMHEYTTLNCIALDALICWPLFVSRPNPKFIQKFDVPV